MHQGWLESSLKDRIFCPCHFHDKMPPIDDRSQNDVFIFCIFLQYFQLNEDSMRRKLASPPWKIQVFIKNITFVKYVLWKVYKKQLLKMVCFVNLKDDKIPCNLTSVLGHSVQLKDVKEGKLLHKAKIKRQPNDFQKIWMSNGILEKKLP